jgi:hypothetical protein
MRLRRTKLYLPGNNPNMLLRGYLFKPDGVILDLEDAVSMSEKDAARILVREVLKQGEFGECEVTVRINGMDTEFWRKDIETVVPCGIDGIRVPKVESPKDIQILDEALSEIDSAFSKRHSASGEPTTSPRPLPESPVSAPAARTSVPTSRPTDLKQEKNWSAPEESSYLQPTPPRSTPWTRSMPT